MKRASVAVQIQAISQKGERRRIQSRVKQVLEDSSHAVVQKLNDGQLDLIQEQDVADLFRLLCDDGSGCLRTQVVAELLEQTLGVTHVEFDVLQKNLEVKRGNVISPGGFFRAITVRSVRTLLKGAHHAKNVRESALENQGHVERAFMVHKVAWRVNRDDAFGTLPLTFIYLIVFMVLIVHHLQIWKRQEMERGIERWIDGQGGKLYGPYLQDHVYSSSSFFTWLNKSVFRGMFRQVTLTAQGEIVTLARSNILFGDILLLQHNGDDYNERKVWLLSHPIAQKILHEQSHDPNRLINASLNATRYFLDPANEWVNDDTKDLSILFFTYNTRAEMYSKTRILVRLDHFGNVIPRVKCNAFVMKAYPSIGTLAVDALYLLLLLNTVRGEFIDMCDAMRVSFKGFLRYWSFRNFVDWATVVLGIANIALWLLCCRAMQAVSLQDLLDDSGEFIANGMNMSTSKVEMISEDLDTLHDLFFSLHFTVAITTCFVVLKFMRALDANPRLQVATQTLRYAGNDILHFLVVLAPIFASFSVVGHVLFGTDLTNFYTLASSFSTGFTVLMGDFDWYVRLSETPAVMPSGMPRVFLVLWLFTYLAFVFLTMLNMLLAIILGHYSHVSDILTARSDAERVWDQALRYTKRKFQTRQFIPLYRIKHELESDSKPAHPGNIVTAESLVEGFVGMKEEQAKWIMDFLVEELRDMFRSSTGKDEACARELRIERLIRTIAEEMHFIGYSVADCAAKLEEMEVLLQPQAIVDSSSYPACEQDVTSILDGIRPSFPSTDVIRLDDLEAIVQGESFPEVTAINTILPPEAGAADGHNQCQCALFL